MKRIDVLFLKKVLYAPIHFLPISMDRYILYFKKDSKAYVDLDKISPKLINWTDFNEIVG
jgi:hypothetical protein